MPLLMVVAGPKTGERIEVGPDFSIGRSPSCSLALPEDGRVSRRHARLLERDGVWAVEDLGSRNGTFVNGERLEGELPLAPGDRVHVGETILVFEPRVRATGGTAEPAAPSRIGAVEEFLPASGDAAALFRSAMALAGCDSEPAALRRGAEEALRLVGADVAAALLPGEQGQVTAAVAGGAKSVEVPQPMLRAACERREAVNAGRSAVVPVWSGGAAFGLLYVERDEPLRDGEMGLLGAVGRLCGEVLAAARGRQSTPERVVVGAHRAFRRCVDQARRAAVGGAPVLIHGEPGTGKFALALYLHQRSSRALAPLVVVDCRQPPLRLERELFGGAGERGRPPQRSALERADGGTLALRGAEALPREMVARLSRFLQSRSAPALGGGESPCDYRLLLTSREPAEQLLLQGRLDPALMEALSARTLSVPPLRERASDVPLLMEFFAQRSRLAQRGPPLRLSPEASELLGAYRWPGNVRELRLCTERLAMVCEDEVQPWHLPREMAAGGAPAAQEKLGDLVAQLERETIARALRKARGKKVEAAALLGISRPTLDKKIALYQLTVK